jgi:hypothetical protein
MEMRKHGPTGFHPVNVKDGTLALTESAKPGPVCGSANAHRSSPRRARPTRKRGPLTLVLKHRTTKASHAHHVQRNPEGQVWRVSKEPWVGWLYDFAVNSAELGSAHKYYLDLTAREVRDLTARWATRQSERRVWKLRIEGRASRTGSDGLNLSLSRDRAYSVHEYLEGKLSGVKVETDWVGEGAAAEALQRDNTENMMWRSVLVSIWLADKPKPPPPPDPPAKPTTITFKIRVIGGSTGALETPFLKVASLSKDHLVIEIVDVEKKLICTYTYDGTGGGVGIGVTPFGPLSGVIYGGSKGGEWKTFQVPRYWTLENIDGPAELHGLGIDTGALLSQGQSGFSFAYPDRKHWYSLYGTVVKISDIDLGETIGTPSAGVAATDGFITPVGKPRHYDGP